MRGSQVVRQRTVNAPIAGSNPAPSAKQELFMFLFCYGSNNPGQLSERLGHMVKVYPAYIEGYQRAYRGYSNKWDGGVATIIKMSGHSVYGLAAEVDDSDIKRMDVYEGYPTSYSRKKMKGYVDGVKKEMIVYIANMKDWNAPSPAYLKAIHKTVSTFWEVDSFKDFYNEF